MSGPQIIGYMGRLGYKIVKPLTSADIRDDAKWEKFSRELRQELCHFENTLLHNWGPTSTIDCLKEPDFDDPE